MTNNCGILGLDAYFPSTFIDQNDLEAANNVSKGKYTIGLGQSAMAFTGDREDINSICLSVVSSLLEKYEIDPKQIGRLEVGTETLIDKSKSTKTVLMELFATSGNHDIEGTTCTNACYGGTAALINALTWCDSSSWDGRYAIVVAADIAVYAEGPARPTGGCGAVAMLIGRDAPLVIDMKTRTTHASNVWDFYKPRMDSEYPEVDGALSESCYLTALDGCYTRFLQKQKQSAERRGTSAGYGLGDVIGGLGSALLGGSSTTGDAGHGSVSTITGVENVDYFLFHSPYNKLVQKSFARILYLDIHDKRPLDSSIDTSEVGEWDDTPLCESMRNKNLEGKMKTISKGYYSTKVAPGCEISKQIGNTYTASVYLNLCWLVSEQGASLAGKNVVLFSYGSGAIATMLSLQPRGITTHGGKFSLATMSAHLGLSSRLAQRSKRDPSDLEIAMKAREAVDAAARPFYPTYSTHSMQIGTYFLASIDEKHRRVYERKTKQESPIGSPPRVTAGNSSSATPDKSGRARSVTEDFNTTATTTMEIKAMSPPRPGVTTEGAGNAGTAPDISNVPEPPSLSRSKTYVWASGRPNVRVVVTGVAAALPGREAQVFKPGVNNIQRIIAGENCITPIPGQVKDSMLEKNVVLLKKNKETGQNSRVPITSHDNNINLCASLGDFDLTEYGVTQSIAATMDVSVQVAVAAGLEALKDAGIVTGDPSTGGWVLPQSMQATTGVVYATSFPALDTAIAEVSKFFQSKMGTSHNVDAIIDSLRSRLEARLGDGEKLSKETEYALAALASQAAKDEGTEAKEESRAATAPYEFDRKFLFRVLVLGNAQLAQIIKARGPNMQTNAACAGSTQAVALAFDMIQVGRAERMIVVAGDNAASDTLMPWLGNGFRALGAATICSQLSLASIPFDKRRSGMILGAGGIGIVLESEEGANRRFALTSPSTRQAAFKCRLLGTLYSNSAYHGASLDKEHIAEEMERFVSSVEKEQGIPRRELALHGVYFSHETSTYASPTSSCASNELYGLRKVFGEHFKDMLILNTKGFTGHPMGVSFEDVVAAEVLVGGKVPPIANYTEGQVDPNLGSDLKISKGGEYPCKYAMRFAAGFGSQIALALYGAPSTA